MASGCVKGGLDWILGKISLLAERSGSGIGCPGRWGPSSITKPASLEVFKKHVRIALQDMI